MDKIYSEGPDSTFYSNGKTYALDGIFRLVHHRQPVVMDIRNFTWILKDADPNLAASERVQRADPSVPIIVVHDPFAEQAQRWIIVDGFHRLAKAVASKLHKLPVKTITLSELKQFELKGK